MYLAFRVSSAPGERVRTRPDPIKMDLADWAKAKTKHSSKNQNVPVDIKKEEVKEDKWVIKEIDEDKGKGVVANRKIFVSGSVPDLDEPSGQVQLSRYTGDRARVSTKL